MKKLKLIIPIISISTVIFLFQNCDSRFDAITASNVDNTAVDNPQELEVLPSIEASSDTKTRVDTNDENCAFPTVKVKNKAVDADMFGPVPKINGILPAKMPLGVPFDGPIAGTEYIRISSNDGNGAHLYSAIQAWNADMTKIAIGSGSVDNNRLLDTTNNYSLLPLRLNLGYNRVWSNVDPDIMYGISGKSTIYKLNVSTGDRTAIYSRQNGADISFMGKVAIPDDDSSMMFLVQDENRLVTIDLLSEKIPRPILGELDWTPYGNLNTGGILLKIDHTGEWAVTKEKNNSNGDSPYLNRLPIDLSTVEQISSMCCHTDSAISTSGESVEVETIGNGSVRVHSFDTKISYDTPIVVNKQPGQTDSRFPIYISGRGQKQCGQGWVVLSGEKGDGSPNHPLVLYKIDGNKKTPSFKVIGGDLHSGAAATNMGESYGKQKAVQSPDGNSILFDSDGGITGGELSTYILRHKEN